MRQGFLGWLSQTSTILCFLAGTLVIGAGFYFILQAIDGPLLDMISSGDGAIARLNEMDAGQRRSHFWGTVTLDAVYPIAYTGLLVGLLCRLAWGWHKLLMLVPMAGALADYTENTVQALALNGHAAEILLAKDIVTPIKSGCLLLALVLCLMLGLVALYRKWAGPKD